MFICGRIVFKLFLIDMEAPTKLVDYMQVDESVAQVIETLQLDPDMSNDLFFVLVNWLDENGYEITNEN